MEKQQEDFIVPLIIGVISIVTILVFLAGYWLGITSEDRRRIREYNKQKNRYPSATKRIV